MDRYVKVRMLGKGSFGNAILIRRRSDNALLVIKEVFLGKMSRKEREEARRECHLLQKLSHPNIVRYIEHFENSNNLYIVMEYCDGGDLHKKLKNGPLNESTILYYYSQVCLALEYLHSRYILHRDIKTMNVFLMKNGSVKLGDFGIATVLRNTMGMANTVCGTPYYFSPEICCNKPYNNKSDVWALGVLLYELATGRHPFNGNSMHQLMQRILKGTYPPLQPHFSQEFCKMVEWCLKKDPAKRPSIKQLLSLPILRRALEQLEENLMLATQCRVRLKDIIDFDVGSDNNKNNNNNNERQKMCGESPAEKQRPSKSGLPSRPAEVVSPGRMAAVEVTQQQRQKQQEQQPPHSQPPNVDGVTDVIIQKHPPYFFQLGPKPSTGCVPLDHNRIENYRQHLQQHYQRMFGADKGVNFGASPVVNDNYTPRAQQQHVQQDVVMGAFQKKHQLPLQQQKNVVQGVVDHRILNNDVFRQKVAAKNNKNIVDGFDDRMKRINAIMQRYAQNVDPKARDTIRAYMKRKQDEYIQEQKELAEYARRREERRKEKLAMVIRHQNRIARGDNVFQQKGRHQGNKLVNNAPAVLPNCSGSISLPSSPQKNQQQHFDNHQPPPPPPPSQLQRQQYKSNAFGRDPRFVPRQVKELEPQIPLQSFENVLKDDNNIIEKSKLASRKKNKALAANSSVILCSSKPQIQLPAQYPVLDPLSNGCRPYSAELAASTSRQPLLNDGESPFCLNRKRLHLQPVSNKRGNSFAKKKVKDSLKNILRQPLQTASKASPSQPHQEKRQSQHQQEQKTESMLRIISAPVFASSMGNSFDTHNDEDAAKREEGHKKIAQAAPLTPAANSRSSSVSLGQIVEDPFRNPTDKLTGPCLGDKSKILSTTAAGFVPSNAFIPSPSVERQGIFASGAQRAQKFSPVHCAKKDLLVGVEDSCGLERQVNQRMEPMQSAKDRLDKDSVTPRLHTPVVEVDFNENMGNNKNNKKIECAYPQSVDENGVIPLSAGISNAEGGQSNGKERKMNLPSPLLVAPLQIRATQSFLPHCNSPSHLTSPSKLVASRKGSRQSFPRITGNNSAQPQATIGIVPILHGVKMSAQSRATHVGVGGAGGGGAGGGSRDEFSPKQYETVNEPPLFVDIQYGVFSAPPLESVAKQHSSVDVGLDTKLPCTTDLEVLQLDVVQRWRNITESSNCHKKSSRQQFAHPQTSLALETQTVDGGCDVLAAFQKANNANLIIPSTLEALGMPCDSGEEDVNEEVGKQSSSPLALPGMMLKGALVPLFSEEVAEKSLNEVAPCQMQASSKTMSNSYSTSHSLLVSSWNDAVVTEERKALVAFVDGALSARTNDECDNCNTSVFSSDNQRDHSLEGYLEMLDHLREVLYSRSKPAKSAQTKLQQKTKKEEKKQTKEKNICKQASLLLEKETSALPLVISSLSKAEDLPTPRDFGFTRSNREHREDCHMQFIQLTENDEGDQESAHSFDMDEENYDDSAEEEIDEESYDDGDDDFEDALPLTPVRCATLNDTYRRLLENAEYVTEVISNGVCLSDDASTRNAEIKKNVGAEEVVHGGII